MKYGSFQNIKKFLDAHSTIIQGKKMYGAIGINQRNQFQEISQDGIPNESYDFKSDFKHKYKVWTFSSSQTAQDVYDQLLKHYVSGLEESPLSDSNNLTEGEAYIYII